MAVKVFICYSHKDRKFVTELVRIFAADQIKGAEVVYDYKFLKLGDQWDPKILSQLASCQIVLALTSLNFMASEYIQLKEWKISYARAQTGECKIIPVRVGAGGPAEIGKFQGVSERLLNTMSPADRDIYYIQLQTRLIALIAEMANTDLQQQKNIEEKDKIFLSIPDSDAGRQMRKLFVESYATARKHDPKKWSYDLVPEINDDFYTKSLEEQQSVIKNCFNKAIYSIHIATSIEDISTGLGKFQFHLTGDFKRIIWCPNDLIKSKIYPMYSQYIFEVGENGSYLLNKILEVDKEKGGKKTELDVKLAPKRKIFFFFKPDEDDKKELFRAIRETIRSRGHELIPAEETTSAEHERILKECRGALIFHGAENNRWSIAKQNFVRGIPNITAHAICIDAPGEDDKEQAVYGPFDSIRKVNFDPKIIQFFEKVERVAL